MLSRTVLESDMFLLLFFGSFITVICAQEPVRVTVEQGVLRGEILNRSTGNGQYYSFKSIPFAAPPVGHLRFMAPQPPASWNGERDATIDSPDCPQLVQYTEEHIKGDEDCLFVNVYTPNLNPDTLLPVMFYIHRGAFVTASANVGELGPDFLIDQNVVLVTVSYRLGALGFLCLDIKEVPGNAGLKDQVAALRWVQKNIEKFGGNKNKITIIGTSAGASSVTLHAVSPMSKGLFKRSISMSGSLFNAWSVPNEPKRHSLLLSHMVGLYTKDPYEAFRFLQNASISAILNAWPNTLAIYAFYQNITKTNIYTPVIETNFGDEHFLLEDPEQMLLDGNTNGVDLIIGHTAQEGVTSTVQDKDDIFKLFPYYNELLIPIMIYPKIKPNQALHLADCVHDHYFRNNSISENRLADFSIFYSQYAYVHPIHRFLEMWTSCKKGNNKAYFYQFSCFSERNVHGVTGIKYGIRKASHLDDIQYLFDGKMYNFTLDKSSNTYKMIVQTSTLMANFAKYGNPTPDNSLGVTWPHYTESHAYLDINLELKTYPVVLTEINFWRSIYKVARQRFS